MSESQLFTRADAAPRFERIDLTRHGDVCVRFRRDSFICSFGDDGRFERESGDDGAGYLSWLRERMAEFPDGFLHIWLGDEIVGQLEMRPRGDPRTGYINLFYLKPAQRGTGISALLHSYATDLFREIGIYKLSLCVSPSNDRAMGFYRKWGWVDTGPRPGQPDVHLMQLTMPDRTGANGVT